MTRATPSFVSLQDALGHAFASPALLAEALTHSSALDGRPGLATLERLEFLGDRVLGLLIAAQLYSRFPDLGESGLAPRLNALVNRAACARAARRAGLGAALILSRAEADQGGRDKETILADACEAVIAALYLDGGMAAASRFVERFWAEEWASLDDAPADPKTVLQEWAARARRVTPRYVVVGRTGPDHAPAFVVEAEVPGLAPARGEGGSKREAERAAAVALLREAGIDL